MQPDNFDELKELMVQGDIDARDLKDRYDIFSSVDDERALKQLEKKCLNAEEREHHEHEPVVAGRGGLFRRHRFIAAAASVAILLAAGGYAWFHNYATVTQPEISPEVQLAMAQSKEAGRQDADITVTVPKNEQARRTAAKSLRQTYHIDDEDIVEQMLTAQHITTRHDKEFWMTLDDGSLVHLNNNSSLITPEKFTGDSRDVILEGEAYFMAAHDKSRPFIVHMAQGSVRVYGTEFNVNTRAGDASQPCAEVVLVKGSVGVTPTGSTEMMMQPGQMATLYAKHSTLGTVDTAPYVAWNTGTFVFEDCPINQLMEVLSKWYGFKVVFLSEDAREKHFTGAIDRYGSIKPTLNAISHVTGLSLHVSDGKIIIE